MCAQKGPAPLIRLSLRMGDDDVRQLAQVSIKLSNDGTRSTPRGQGHATILDDTQLQEHLQ